MKHGWKEEIVKTSYGTIEVFYADEENCWIVARYDKQRNQLDWESATFYTKAEAMRWVKILKEEEDDPR